MQDLLIDSPQAGAWPDLMARLGGPATIAAFVVTPLSEGEKLDRVTIRPGEVYLGDRGYPQPQALANTRAEGGDVLVRLTWNSLNLRDERGHDLDWMALFATVAQTGGLDCPVTVHKSRGRFAPLPLRLVILPKPPEIAAKARKIARNTARK